MKLHLPLTLRSAILSCLLAAGAAVSSAADSFTASPNLGNTMFVGDSLTHGIRTASYRWEIHKIFTDNNIAYNEVGIATGNNANGVPANTLYGNKFFRNQHSAKSGGYAHQIAGTSGRSNFQDMNSRAANYFGTNIKQWLGLEDYTTTPANGEYRLTAADMPSTFFLLIGTNDLNEGGNNVSTNGTYDQIKINLLGNKSAEGVYDGSGDLDTIIDSMRQSSPDANIVMLTVPTWAAESRKNNNSADRNKKEDLGYTYDYNEALTEWAKQKGVTLIQSDRGMIDVAETEWVGQGVKDLFAGEGLHPNDYGDLIIGGNVAKALGFAGRTAGQERKSAADFALNYDAIRNAGIGWGDISAPISAGSTSTYNWGAGADLSHGFTVDFSIKGVGNGSDGGWNTTDNFSVSIGDGTHYGTLNINEAYIQWGDSVLYSLDMKELTESLRIAYIYGNASRGLPTGFYVWLDDQLIAEARDNTGNTAINGLTITNNTGGTITLESLSLDGTGAWAPTTGGVENGNPLIAPTGTTFDYGDFPGRKDWCGDDELLDTPLTISNDSGIAGSLGGKKGATINGTSNVTSAIINSDNYTGDMYVTMSENLSIGGYWGFHGRRGSGNNLTFKGDGYLRLVGITSTLTPRAFFGTLNAGSGGIVGDLYVEFSSENVTINDTSNYGGVKPSIAGVFNSMTGITGTYRVVINEGTFGHIIGGATDCEAPVGAVELFLNGGTLVGNVAAGGYKGNVGNRSITITGDRTIFAPAVTMITAGAISDATLFGGTAAPTGTVSGKATVTLADITQESNFSQWTGTLSGGQECSGRTLVFSGAKLPELKATIENFDTITLKNEAEVGLKSLGGAGLVVTEGESTLTLLANAAGEEYVVKVDNNATVQLAENVALRVTGVSADAAALKGAYELAAGSTLTLEDGVQGDYSVSLVDGSTLNIEAGVEGSYHLALNGGGTLNGVDAAGVVGRVSVSDATAAGNCTFDLNNALNDGKMQLTLSALSAGSRVIGIGNAPDGIVLAGDNNITLGSSMLQSTGALLDTDALLQLAADATLNVQTSAIANDLEALDTEGSVEYYLSHGDLTKLQRVGGRVKMDAAFVALGMTLKLTKYGALLFEKAAETDTPAGSNIYISSDDNTGSNWGLESGANIYDSVGGYDAVVVTSSTTIDLTGVDVPDTWAEDGLTIHNLMGSDTGDLVVKGDPQQATKVTLSNALSDAVIKNIEQQYGVQVEKTLTFDGNITISDAELQVKHMYEDVDGMLDVESTTVLRGNLTLEGAGGLTLTSGVLQLEGAANDLGEGGIRFAGNDGQLVLGEEATLTVRGALEEQKGYVLPAGAREHVRLEGGVLDLRDGASVGAGLTLGNEDAALAGTLSVGSGVVTVDQKSRLAHVLLHVQEGAVLAVPAPRMRSVSADEPVWDLAGMTGGGELSGAKDMSFTVAGADRTFTGSLEQYSGTMSFAASDYAQRFTGVKGGTGWNVANNRGGRVVFDLAGANGSNSLTMGSLALERGSFTSILLDLPNAKAGDGLHLQSLQADSYSSITIGQYEGLATLAGQDGDTVTLATITVAQDDGSLARQLNGVSWYLTGIRNASDVFIEYSGDDRTVYLKTYIDGSTTYANFADNKNSLAGARMLWNVENSYVYGGDLAGLDTVVYALLMESGRPEIAAVNKANEILAAAAGSSTAVMGQAFGDDVDRQLRLMRNRALSLTYSKDPGEVFNVWLNAESDYHKQEADGMLPGYKKTGWGGTVGMSASVSKDAALGLALTAMYNDLTGEGPDHLKGDMDTYYVSAFAQVKQGAWQHSFIATLGQAQLDVERTVDYGLSRYKTKGSTDGMALGLMYEAGYSIPLNEAKDSVLQPILNISFRHAAINGYTESSASNAALRVGDQQLNSVTFGLGARYQTIVDSVWNKSCVFEARAIVKARAGDSSNESKVAFLHEGALQGKVESASSGSVGVEFGAGLSVPVGKDSDVFFDVNAELWGNYTNANAVIGYKMQF